MSDNRRVFELAEQKRNANKSSARKVFELLGNKFDDDGNIVVDLIAETNVGKKNFGKVTYDAYKAVKGNTLDSYKPKNDEEKKVLDGYKNQLAIPFTIEIDGETKNFGNITYDGYTAINSNNFDTYKPKNDEEKKAFDGYTKFVEEYAKKQREPENPGQGFFHSIGYTAEKLGAGAIDGLSDAGKFLLAGGAKLLSIPAWGSWEEGLNKTAEFIINDKTVGDVWDNSIESRYRVPDWYRESVGTAAFNIGSLAPAIVAEVATYSASPMLELQLANSAAKVGIKGTIKSAAKNLSTKLVKPKVSDAVFGLSAAGSAAEAGYKQSGDVGKALKYGILNGLGEVATEKLFGGIGGTGIGADELWDVGKTLSKIKGISKLASTKYGKKVLDIAFEGVEEVIMADADPWFQKLTINPEAEINHILQTKFWKDRGEAFAQGILLSGLMNAGTFAINKTANTANKIKAIKVVNNATNGINALLENDADKLVPLKYGASIDEIKQRQNEIGVFTMAYADIMVDELVKNNPEKFARVEKVSVGDTFKDTKTGYTITVTGRNEKSTTVEIDTGTNTITKQFANKQADRFVESEQLVDVESSDTATSPIENTVVAENTTPENQAFADYESEADELMETDMSEDVETAVTENTISPEAETLAPEEAQKYNIVVSNLKRKAEELGLLDSKFFTALQNVNLYNPTASDRALISNEFQRVFANNTDPLVTNWLNDIGVDTRPVTSINEENMHDSTGEKTATTAEAENKAVAEETAADNTQLPEAFKTDESGKIRFNQMDIDYNNNSMRKGQFKTVNVGWKSQTVNGFLCGKYGVHKSDKADKYVVTLLQSGMIVRALDKVTEAKKVAAYLDANLSFNDVSYNKTLSDNFAIERTDEFQSYLSEVKKILDNKEYEKSESVATEIKDGKVPFKTKTELVDYVKAHIGDKVKATFNNGNSEVRTLHAISNTSLRTKRPDGSVVTSKLKGVEYNDNGIHIDFKNGVAVTFDFVNVGETELSKSSTELSDKSDLDNMANENASDTDTTISKTETVGEVTNEVLKNQSESDTIEEKPLREEGAENGVDERGSVSEKPEQRSKAQETGKQSEEVQDRLSSTSNNGTTELLVYRRGYSDTARRIEQIEQRTIDEVSSTNDFKELKDFVNDSISNNLFNILYEHIYKADTRITEKGYDFEDVFAYDLISGKEKELASLFYDEISGYFNQNNSEDVDSTGKTVLKSLLEKLKQSIVRNDKGQLIPLYHSTTANFGKFEIGDIGHHFGSYIQAYQRNIDNEDVRYIKAYLNITKPLIIEKDNNAWHATHIIKDLVECGIITFEQGEEFIHSEKDVDVLNAEMRKIINDAGYDGIIYKNQYESGYANSYIVFDDSQIIRVEDDTKPTKSNKVLSACEKTIKPEIVSNAEIMGMLANKFGDNGIDGIVNEIITRYNRDKTIGDFENLFTDGGKEIYDALRNQEDENAKYSYSMESEENYEGQGNLLHDDSEQWYAREYPGEQVAGLVKATERGSKTAKERKDFTSRLKLNQLEKKIVTDREGNKHTFFEIKLSAWNSQMNKIADYYAQKSVNVHFIKGGVQIAFVGEDRTANAMRIGNDIYISYDNAWYTPEQLSMHEYIHIKYDKSPEFQKTVQDILEILPKREYNRIVEKVKKAYGDIIDNPYAYEEELICDVLSGMTPSSLLKSGEIVLKFWARESIDVQGYDTSQYAESIDAGGINEIVLNNVMFTDENHMLRRGDIAVSVDEYAQLSDFIIDENYSNKIKSVSGKEIGNNFYVWRNIGKNKFRIEFVSPIGVNNDFVEFYRNEVINNDGEAETIWKMYSYYYEGQGDGIGGRTYAERNSPNGRNDEVSQKEFREWDGIDGRENSGESNRDTVETDSGIEPKINYALSSHDSDVEFWEEWLNLVKEYGAIPKGENPTRNIDVPQKISDKKVVSQFARTMLEAGITPDTAVSEFEKRVLDGTMTHEVITNDAARKWAINQIKYHGFEEALNSWEVYTRDGNVGKKELALGMELYNQCITSGDATNAMKIAAELVAEATHAGQTLQATRMLKLMTPDGQLYYLEKSIQKMNDEFKKKIGDKYEDIKLNEDLMEKFLTEKEADKRDEIYNDICQDIADQIPATFLDKWNSWRYLAMLGNPRTHIRNIAGNAVFTPAIKLKNYIGAVIERTAKVDTSKRTKSLYKSKKNIEFAKSDFSKMQKVLQGENAKYAVTSDIEGKRTIFKTKWLEWLRNKNFEWLEKEDMWFLKMHYVDALAQILTARNIDVNNIDEKTLDIARAYAVREAQRATYRDANSLAEALNKLQKKAEHSDKKAIRATNVLLEGVMPFKKTPLNIAKQGVQYSPVGILSGVYKTVSKVKNGDAYSTTDIIDDFAKGLTGTAIMLLGTFLASLGIISGGDDENKKKKEFDKMVGEQSFSLNIGDSSYTIDWMTPACLPLFTGVELYELTKDDFKFADIANALSSLTDPLLELSVFSGINGAIESAQYNDTNTLFAIGSDMTTSYLTQVLPTIGGQLSRIIDKNKREYYYTDKNSNLPKGVQSFIGKASSKIPFASYLFEPSIDEWGREETYGNIVERTFENVVSPGYYSEKNYTEVDEEIKRLYESTGDSDVLPVIQQKKYTESKIDYPMTAAQYTEAKRTRGQKSFEYVRELLDDKTKVKLKDPKTGKYSQKRYSQMSDEEKVRAVKRCYEQAGDETKETMLEKIKKRKASK